MEEVTNRRTLLLDVNPHLLCVLCAGYYIDPTTIVECLHSFCRSCILKYLEASKFCPICDVQLHKTKPLLSLRRDTVLERIVYKVVPGLYANEMKRRGLPLEEVYLTPDDSISLVLQYHVEDTSSQKQDDEENLSESNQDSKIYKKYLKCPAAVTVELLKKFVILKYSLTDQHQVEIIHASEFLPDDITLMDIAYCFDWKMTAPLELSFQILEKSTVAVPIVEEVEAVEDVDVDVDDDSQSVASSSLPFMSSKSISDCDDASNTSLDSKPLIERLESERMAQKRKRGRETVDDGPEPKKSLFDSLLQSSTTNNNENETMDFQESDEDYSKYEQDIEEIIEEEEEDDDDEGRLRISSNISEDEGRLRISSNISEDEVNNDETTSQMFVIDEAVKKPPAEEEKHAKVAKEKHWKSEGRNKRKSKKAKHHHHHKRRLSQSPPPTATIVHSPDRDIMKLKVKLNTLPGYRHKDDKHHKHGNNNKHNAGGSASSASSIVSSPARSSYKEDDSVLSEQSCDSVVVMPKKSVAEEIVRPPQSDKQPAAGDVRKPPQTPRRSSPSVSESPRSDASSCAKEPQPSSRSARSKPRPTTVTAAAVEQQQLQTNAAETSHKMIIMPPSSITVSIITAEEKLKMEKDKTLMLSGSHDFENKRPSLEIVRVNGPPSASAAAVNADVPRSSPKPREQQHQQQQHEDQQPPPSPSPRPKTKKPVPAVIPIKSAKPSLTIIPQNKSPGGNCTNNNNNHHHNNSGAKHEEIKSSVTISLENGCQNDSALDLSGKSSRKDAGGQQYSSPANVNKSAPTSPLVNGGGGQYESPSMRNLMTLSDTAVHIRNMMSTSSSSPSPPCRDQHDAKKRFGNHNSASNNSHHNGTNNHHLHGTNSNHHGTSGNHHNANSSSHHVNSGGHAVGGGSCSPKRHNGSVPLRIPVPPASGSFGKAAAAAGPAQNKPPKVVAAGPSRASDAKPKHGPPNQAVRHIPNPSVLLFRHHQQHLAQLAASAAAAAGGNKRPGPAAVPPTVAPSRAPPLPMAANALPLHTIRKMENMTKNIEKVAAGLSVKANALYKQNFIENGRARLELPS